VTAKRKLTAPRVRIEPALMATVMGIDADAYETHRRGQPRRDIEGYLTLGHPYVARPPLPAEPAKTLTPVEHTRWREAQRLQSVVDWVLRRFVTDKKMRALLAPKKRGRRSRAAAPIARRHAIAIEHLRLTREFVKQGATKTAARRRATTLITQHLELSGMAGDNQVKRALWRGSDLGYYERNVLPRYEKALAELDAKEKSAS
jgi:hypothetical protein